MGKFAKKEDAMPYEMKKLSCDPSKLKGLSKKLIVSHYENNYGGAVKRLNAITAQLESLDFATAPVFVINGLKREELIVSHSVILHELYFDGLGSEGEADKELRSELIRDFGGELPVVGLNRF
jgi:superoxide dismutase, Fe-Mn family